MNSERIAILKSYIEKEPTNPFNKYALAMEYYEAQPERAMQLLTTLTSEHPDYLPTYYKAAHLFWEYEKYHEAEDMFTKGIEFATHQNNKKALEELKAAFLNFQYERD